MIPVKVEGAPGFEDFEGELILSAEGPDGPLCVVGCRMLDGESEVFVISGKYVTEVEDAY